MVDKVEEFEGDYSMVCSFKSMEDNLSWAFGGVYGSNLDSDHFLLWEELAGIISWRNFLHGIRGDFNVIRLPSE